MRAGLFIFALIVIGLEWLSAQHDSRPPTPLGLDAYYPVPDENPVTPEKIALGRALFFDTGLSSDRTVACATCHKPERAFSDEAPISSGAEGRKGLRHTPALVNRAYGKAFFWDGRARTLEAQVLDPITNPLEMNLTLETLTTRLGAEPRYRQAFADVFNEAPSPHTAAMALATFVRAQRFGNSAFDRYDRGDSGALSAAAGRGFALFRGRAGCSVCHVGPNFTDEKFHNTGVSWGSADLGRFLITGRDADRGAFKTQTLREITRTAPYMHDGSIATIAAVVSFYNAGGRVNPHLDSEIAPLSLADSEVRDLEVFLATLTSLP